MNRIRNLYEKAQENNVFAGIVIVNLFSIVFFLINPIPILLPGDLPLLLSLILGQLFALKNRKKGQKSFYVSSIVGLVGGLLSAFSLAIIMFIVSVEFSFARVLFLTLLVGMGLAVMISAIFGTFYWYKDKRKTS